MKCSETSDVTVVITSCGRFDLLGTTLHSFITYNSYPVKRVIIMEDSGQEAVWSVVPPDYHQHFTVIVNKPKLGQVQSIDTAYGLVDTKYIFHCEDDWEFYRSGFIEDAKQLLEQHSAIYQVWLRSYYHDVRRHYPFHTLGDRIATHGVVAHRLLSSNYKWQGFSFNPGLRRLADYQVMPGGYGSFFTDKAGAATVESALSQYMVENGKYAAILENDAVAHIGHGRHIHDCYERAKKRRRTVRAMLVALLIFGLGWLAGSHA